ncbi:UNVERIFIED_CONTAM: hypothetical protein RMT77_015154 [Armadillidium vulgare]
MTSEPKVEVKEESFNFHHESFQTNSQISNNLLVYSGILKQEDLNHICEPKRNFSELESSSNLKNRNKSEMREKTSALNVGKKPRLSNLARGEPNKINPNNNCERLKSAADVEGNRSSESSQVSNNSESSLYNNLTNSHNFTLTTGSEEDISSEELEIALEADPLQSGMQAWCIIEDLVRHSFSKRKLDEQKIIVKNKRPTPNLPNLRTEGKKFVRHFQETLYEKNSWVAGSAVLNKLFCWPCLLFSSEKSVWNEKGYNDLNNLHSSLQKHERTQRHIKSCIDLISFGNSRVSITLDHQRKLDIEQHNKKVTKNRDVLRRLIDVVVFLGCQELSFRGHNESNTSKNRGNYLELVNLISQYDEKLANHLSSATVFSGLSNRIQNDLIESVQNVILKRIHDEVMEAKFVSILLDEISDTSNCSQLSTVLRYITNDYELVERFIGFTDVSNDRSTDALANHVFRCVENLKCENRLIAQTYDGATTDTDNLSELRAKVNEKYPSAVFVHSCAHGLNFILSQACRRIKDCKVFFSVLNGLDSFFSKVSQNTDALDNILKRFPKNAQSRLNHLSRFIQAIKESRVSLRDIFEGIIDNPEKWDEKAINSAFGLKHRFEDFTFNFLLEVFSELLPVTDALFKVLQTRSLEITCCLNEAQKTIKFLKEKEIQFLKFYDQLEEDFQAGKPYKQFRSEKITDPLNYYKTLYSIIVQTIVNQLEARFSSLDNLLFIELLNCSKFKLYAKDFPEEAFKSLSSTYGSHFDIVRLQNELTVAYSLDEFCKKSVVGLMKHIREYELDEAMPEFKKLCNLIVTIPSTTITVEKTFFAAKRIKTYQSSMTSDARLSGLALMSVEKSLLQKLKNSKDFHERVIDEFDKKDRRIELTYK